MEKDEKDIENIDLDLDSEAQEEIDAKDFVEQMEDEPTFEVENEIVQEETLDEASESIQKQDNVENNKVSLDEKLASQDEFAFLDDEDESVDEVKDEQVQNLEPVVVEDDLEDEKTDDNQELITVRPVKFQQFELTQPNRTIKKNLDIMQDVSLHVSVELGRTKSSIREVMELEKGSIVELDKIAGEQVEIFVNGKLVAKGEVIVIEDKFGVRVTSTNIQKVIQ